MSSSPTRRRTQGRPAWSGMAVVVEAMVLLVFLLGSLAVITQLFAAASVRAQEGRLLAEAVAAATTTAERFAADPASVEDAHTEGDLTVRCDVTSEKAGTGTLYHATIRVFGGTSKPALYTLTTARYEREVS